MRGIQCSSFCLAQCGLSKEWFVFVQPVAPLPYLHSSFWTRGCYQRPWMKQLPSTLHHSSVQVLPRLWKCCVLPVVSDTLLANGSWLWSNLIPHSEPGFGCFGALSQLGDFTWIMQASCQPLLESCFPMAEAFGRWALPCGLLREGMASTCHF